MIQHVSSHGGDGAGVGLHAPVLAFDREGTGGRVTFGQRVRAWRGQRSRLSVARAYGVAEEHLSNIEYGLCLPGRGSLARLAQALGVRFSHMHAAYVQEREARGMSPEPASRTAPAASGQRAYNTARRTRGYTGAGHLAHNEREDRRLMERLGTHGTASEFTAITEVPRRGR